MSTYHVILRMHNDDSACGLRQNIWENLKIEAFFKGVPIGNDVRTALSRGR